MRGFEIVRWGLGGRTRPAAADITAAGKRYGHGGMTSTASGTPRIPCAWIHESQDLAIGSRPGTLREVVMQEIRAQRGGSGSPTLLLLHGLGATSDVWSGMLDLIADRWPGGWVAPDLPGHGGSAPLPLYTFDGLAAAVAKAVPPTDDVVVLGHSLGGVVGLALANGSFGLPVSNVIGLGIKVGWTTAELERAREMAATPLRQYQTRSDAVSKHLRLAGLTGLIDPDDPILNAAVEQRAGRWRVRFDPAAFAVGAPDMPRLLAEAQARVVLVAGEHDHMYQAEHLSELVPSPVILAHLGHNAHVQAPEVVWQLTCQATI